MPFMLATLGFSRSDIDRLIIPVIPHDLGDQSRDVLFARACWSTITEPGDRIAGVLIEQLGAVDALKAVLEGLTSIKILSRFSGYHDDEFPAQLAEALMRWTPRLQDSAVVKALEHAAGIGAYVVSPETDMWPSGLNDLEYHKPYLLWVRGHSDHLASFSRSISIVGARASTGYGEHVTAQIVPELVDNSMAIVSGAAYGIDGMAHRSALASEGITMAFLAGGIDRFYPSGHDALLGRLVSHGLVLSELPCGWAPTKWRFLLRNRLIASVSQATIVVEAGWRSGSLNTANHAASLGRPLGVVPGPITSASSAGCHRLLREYAATCVTTAQEVLELVGR
jgi:DNA processing protein